MTAGGDNSICVLDSRFPADHITHKMPEGEEVESACWNVNNQSQIAYTTSQGNLYLFDVRKSSQPLIGQRAHTSKANDLKITSKNMCFTCSEDNTVRVWNLNDLTEPIASKNPKCVVISFTSGRTDVLGIDVRQRRSSDRMRQL
jgi:WD40 repeat protein